MRRLLTGIVCSPEATRMAVQTDPNPPGKFRVLGPLSKMPEFQKASSRKAGSATVRTEAERCVLW
jgi:putative endopeptidase